MKILLDTNIIIHRETDKVINHDIGILFKWFDNLHHSKCIHPVTVAEIECHKDPLTVKSFKAKIGNYNLLKTTAPLHADVQQKCSSLDSDENDCNDTLLLNELYSERVDMFVTEDRRIHHKASLLGISQKIFSIEDFIEKATAENPALADYKVSAVKKEYFGNIDLSSPFFDSFKRDYPCLDKWFNGKSDETVYICESTGRLIAFLYLKPETEQEDYSDVTPVFTKKRRLKIGTFKVKLNGYKLGERFLKIVFDNAVRFKVDEIYITIFTETPERRRLIYLLEEYGFYKYGYKTTGGKQEAVYIRDFSKKVSLTNPKTTYPFLSTRGSVYLISILPDYHTNLLPDSILNTESPASFIKNEPYRNAIKKVFVSHSHERSLKGGDLIILYRTGGYYKSVITTIGIIENVITEIKDQRHFVELCGKRSVFKKEDFPALWNKYSSNKPFVVNFLYAYSFPVRINMKAMIGLGIIKDVSSAPRGFTKISTKQFKTIIKETKTDESTIVD